MPTREETARAFAAAMGWEFRPLMGDPERNPIRERFSFTSAPWCGRTLTLALYLPAPGAPLHEHLAFVGRVAEALAPMATPRGALAAIDNDGPHGWMVRFSCPWPDLFRGVAPDPSWAAMLAAIEAMESKS